MIHRTFLLLLLGFIVSFICATIALCIFISNAVAWQVRWSYPLVKTPNTIVWNINRTHSTGVWCLRVKRHHPSKCKGQFSYHRSAP